MQDYRKRMRKQRRISLKGINQKKKKSGQRLEEAYPCADLFINIDDPDGSIKLITRFLDAFFGSNSVSPTHDEYGMHAAKNASLRSVDLSRQVGAAISSIQLEKLLLLVATKYPKRSAAPIGRET